MSDNSEVPLWSYDLPHVGVLCKRMRESRGVRPVDIVNRFRMSAATISRIESGKRVHRNNFLRYVDALSSHRLSFPPLTPQQAEVLRRLYDYSRPDKIQDFQSELAVLDLDDVMQASSQYLPELYALVDKLRDEERPALINDDLWFDHAVNAPLFQLFDMHPDDDYLGRWENWHSMAIRLRRDLPVRQSLRDLNTAMPLNVQLFFSQAKRYLFTLQMRHLLHRLHLLSDAQSLGFDSCWSQSTTLSFPFEPKVLQTTSRHYVTNGQEDEASEELRVEMQVQGTYPIEVFPGYTVNFHLVTWTPLLGYEYTRRKFEEIGRSSHRNTVYFAAKYDLRKDFHVNRWDELRSVLEHLVE